MKHEVLRGLFSLRKCLELIWKLRLQVFSKRIPLRPRYANCMTNPEQAFPAADIFHGVSGRMTSARPRERRMSYTD